MDSASGARRQPATAGKRAHEAHAEGRREAERTPSRAPSPARDAAPDQTTQRHRRGGRAPQTRRAARMAGAMIRNEQRLPKEGSGHVRRRSRAVSMPSDASSKSEGEKREQRSSSQRRSRPEPVQWSRTDTNNADETPQQRAPEGCQDSRCRARATRATRAKRTSGTPTEPTTSAARKRVSTATRCRGNEAANGPMRDFNNSAKPARPANRGRIERGERTRNATAESAKRERRATRSRQRNGRRPVRPRRRQSDAADTNDVTADVTPRVTPGMAIKAADEHQNGHEAGAREPATTSGHPGQGLRLPRLCGTTPRTQKATISSTA